MIKIENLNKIFLTEDIETTALNNINLEINKGDFIALMGPSGCGKSTLLNVIGLLSTPTSGNYYFDGVNVANYNEQQRTVLRKGNIGFIFQSFNLIDELNVFENIELPLVYMNILSKDRKLMVNNILKRMNIDHRVNHFPRQLSGGQQQRVAICRALVINPKLILADEPTGNLDSSNGEEVMNILSELNKSGSTIIMVTHSDRDASYALKNVKLNDGKIVSF